MIAADQPQAGRAMAAGQAMVGRLAQQAACGGQGKLAFAYARQAMDQPGVRKALALRQPISGKVALPGQKLGKIAHKATCCSRPSCLPLSRSTMLKASATTSVSGRAARSEEHTSELQSLMPT